MHPCSPSDPHLLEMVPCRSTAQQLVEKCKESQKYANKGEEEEDCQQVSMHVNNAGLRHQLFLALWVFHDGENVFITGGIHKICF